LRVNFLKNIKKVADACTFEVRGFICKNKIFFVKNGAQDPESTFLIPPRYYFDRIEDISCVFHSHPKGEAILSDADICSAREAAIPNMVYSVENGEFCFYDPKLQKSIYFSL